MPVASCGARIGRIPTFRRTCRTTANWSTCSAKCVPTTPCAGGYWSTIPPGCTGPESMTTTRIGLLGYGEVGQRFAADLRAAHPQLEIATFDLLLHQAAAGEGLRRHA